MSVKKQNKKYIKYAPKWKRVRDVLSGQDEMRAAGTAYIPQLTEQSSDDYKAMLKRTPFYNASWRTVNGMNGLIFRKPPEMVLPKSVTPYLEDVSMQSVPLESFLETVVLEEISIGNCGILVDHPPMIDLAGQEMTVAQAEQYGLRPTMQLYKMEKIINWKFRKIKNKHTLCMVVLEECHLEPDGEFDEKEETRWRVLDLDEKGLYRVRVYKMNEHQQEEIVEGPIYPTMNSAPLEFIPFYFDPEFEEPPLIDLIDANITHFQVSCDYRHGVHFTALPTPVITGVNNFNEDGTPGDKYYIGSTFAWVFANEKAQAKFLEFTGTGLKEVSGYLDRIENYMVILGARMLATEKAGVEAYKTQANRQMGETSILSQLAIATSYKVREALKVFCNWAGSKDKIEFELNRDFSPVVVDSATITSWVSAWQNGALSERELFDLLKRGDVIEAEKTFEDHQGEIDAEPPPAPANAQPGRLGVPTHEEDADNAAAAAKKLAEAVPPKPAGK